MNTHTTTTQARLRKGHRVNFASALSLRKLRTRIRHTSNIVSTTGRVFEEPGALWQANMETRTINWTPSFPLPPYGPLTDDSILYLVAHEASHLNWSGTWHMDEVPDAVKHRFHRFVNAVEDIRVDRLSAKEFGGFWEAKVECDMPIREHHIRESKPEEWSLIDQLALNYIYSVDLGLEPFGSDTAKELTQLTWPTISRYANVESTQRLAELLWPFFENLLRLEKEQAKNSDNGSGYGDMGLDPEGGESAPSTKPEQSEGDPDTAPLPAGAEIKGIAEDASAEGAAALADMLEEAVREQAQAERAADLQGTGTKRRGALAEEHGATYWEKERSELAGPISALANKLKATLRTNAAENYEGGQRRGRLHTQKAYRSLAGNPRIFRKRTATGATDYTFGILVDRSGSMQHVEAGDTKSKGKYAFAATVLISEALDRAGLGCFVITWDFDPVASKSMRESLSGARGRLGASLVKPDGGSTYEAPALVMAEEEFGKVRSGHRMLFTITDGQTTGPNESQSMIEELEANGVRCIAIGLGFEPASYYKERLVLASAEELATVLPRFINSMVKKGRH